MIVKNDRHYYGLHLVDTAITDTSRKSSDYLRIDSLPDQLTPGKNLIKLYGNAYKFLVNSVFYIEVLDSAGNVIYSEVPFYEDSLKRKFLIIDIDDDTASGPATITILTTLRDEYVPYEYRGRVNFKWQTVINVTKTQPNTTEIVYQTPPEVILQTRVRPFVTTSFRNSEETITREYGDYKFLDYSFSDYIGDADASSNIFQKNNAYKKLPGFTGSSITSFNRNNVFYLREENYSAKSLHTNTPNLKPGDGFFVQFNPNIVKNGNFEPRDGSATDSNWEYNPAYYTVIASPDPNYGNTFQKPTFAAPASETFFGQQLNLIPNNYYLVSLDGFSFTSDSTHTIYLGYSKSYESGSISENVTGSIILDSSTVSYYSIVKASDGGPYLWIGNTDAAFGAEPYITNIQVFPITSLGADFKYESDVNGGFIKVHTPGISPQTSSAYTLLPKFQGSQIIDGDPAYSSYIDAVLQESDADVEDRLSYTLIPKTQLINPESEKSKIHVVNSFTSSPGISQTPLNNLFRDEYSLEYSLAEPGAPGTPLTAATIGAGTEMYGIFYSGGTFGRGGLYRYETLNDEFTVLENFPGFPGPANPDTTLLFLENGNRPGLYGTSGIGGRYDSGSIYYYNTNTGVSSVLYSFGRPTSASGYQPAGPLMQASNGLLYGTTFQPVDVGGGYGVIYSFNTASRAYSIVHQTASYGSTNLVELNGDLWGVTPFVGGNGTIFRFSLSTGDFQNVHTFNGSSDGRDPRGLTLGADGKLYGITYTSTTPGVGGVIFSYDTSSTVFTPLYSLNTVTEGEHCERPLFEDSGYFYGICDGGGASGFGTVFRFSTASLTFENLHDFTGAPDGKGGKSSLLRIGNSLYGTTINGGTDDVGSIIRLDRVGINRPFIEKESGLIYHRNSIVPYEIPLTSELILDYPRWTGPIVVGSDNNYYSIIELELKNLEPLTGDVSKVQLYAKPKGIKSEFVDIGIYPTTPVDILLDNNFVNHVQYLDSPYRLTGYFKPTITTITENVLESKDFTNVTFLKGWNTGSITSSYFKIDNFESSISIGAAPGANLAYGSTIKFSIDNSPSDNGLAYAVCTSSLILSTTASNVIWEQIKYNLFSAVPMPAGLDVPTYNHYTASAGNNLSNLNNILVYSAIVTKTGSINIEDIYAVSPSLNNRYDPASGSSVSASSYGHPFTFNGKLGWKTDLYQLAPEVVVTQSLYPALFFEYNVCNNQVFNNTIDVDHPHVVEVSNIVCREIGDRDYIRDKYWKSYTYTNTIGTTLITTASVSANTDKLMDSAKLSVLDGTEASSSQALGYLNKNKLVFQTLDSYKFYKNVPYVISFNAFSQINELNAVDIEELGDPDFSDPIGPGWSRTGRWSESLGNYKKVSFATDRYGILTRVDTYPIGTYKFKIDTGIFTSSSFENPISLGIRWNGVLYETLDVQPNSSYEFIVTNDTAGSTFSIEVFSTYMNPDMEVYLLGVSMKRYNYDFVNNTFINPVRPSKSKLRVFGINSLFGVPFADQLATPEIGEFIGELEQKVQYSMGETKNYNRIEMEFEAETDGFGYIAFESDLGATWYISDISVKPKDRIGITPGVTRLFVKLPNDLVNKPLTFKIEYMNDVDEKAPYATILNDVVFSNVDEQQSKNKNSLNVSSVPTKTDNSNISGPNTSAL